MEEARALFRNPDTTEFVIVTIPTVMAAAETARLADALRKESVPVNTVLVNQACARAESVGLPEGGFMHQLSCKQDMTIPTIFLPTR